MCSLRGLRDSVGSWASSFGSMIMTTADCTDEQEFKNYSFFV